MIELSSEAADQDREARRMIQRQQRHVDSEQLERCLRELCLALRGARDAAGLGALIESDVDGRTLIGNAVATQQYAILAPPRYSNDGHASGNDAGTEILRALLDLAALLHDLDRL